MVRLIVLRSALYHLCTCVANLSGHTPTGVSLILIKLTAILRFRNSAAPLMSVLFLLSNKTLLSFMHCLYDFLFFLILRRLFETSDCKIGHKFRSSWYRLAFLCIRKRGREPR